MYKLVHKTLRHYNLHWLRFVVDMLKDLEYDENTVTNKRTRVDILYVFINVFIYYVLILQPLKF